MAYLESNPNGTPKGFDFHVGLNNLNLYLAIKGLDEGGK